MTAIDKLLPRWLEISALLDEGLSLPTAQRSAWLEQLSDSQAQLKEALRELLCACDGIETGDFLRTLPRLGLSHDVHAADAEPAAGRTVGPYRLISELGHGGMGTVWLAERADGAFARQVALKLPRMTQPRPDLAARFARERDILARLEHPNIARLYDAGIDRDGLPYLAMEHVNGKTLDAYADQRRLDLPARLSLFMQVLEAVQYAHANLVIHRDLKPSNILVTTEGQVRLLDFGIAKLLVDATDAKETELTQMSGRALTPDYASPEQIRGETLTIASDIYSLGVVLYVLLVGRRPYRLKVESAAQLEDAIVNADPPRPSSGVTAAAAAARNSSESRLRRALAGDLDTIVLKALTKAPSERYVTVSALAQDLDRHLRQEPIAARPAGAGLRVYKLMLRNRAVTAAIAGVFISLTTGLAAALWQASVAREQARFALQASGRHEGVRHFYAELVPSIAALDPAAFAQPRSIANLVKHKLHELEAHYTYRQADWAGILNAAVVLFSNIGEPEEVLNTSVKYRDVLVRTRADPVRVAEAHVSAGRNAMVLGRLKDSEKFLRDGLAWVPDSPDATAEALRMHLVLTADLGVVLARSGRRLEAKHLLERARELASARLPGDQGQAILMLHVGRFELGYDNVAALVALEYAQRIFAASPETESTEMSASRHYLGNAYLELGRLDEAETQLRGAREMFTQQYGRTDYDTLAALGSLALASARREQYATAANLLAEGQNGLAGKTERKHLAMAAALIGRQLEGGMLAGDLAAAEAALSLLSDPDVSDPTVPYRHVLPLARIDLLLQRGALDQAKALLDSYRSTTTANAQTSGVFAAQLLQLRLLLAGNDAVGAAQAGRDLLRTMHEAGVTTTWELVTVQEWAAVAAAEAGYHDRAALLLDEAARKRATIAPPSRVELADSDLRQARLLLRSGRTAEAKRLAQTALDRLKNQHPDSPRLSIARQLLATAE